jgi:hypothetical protein
LLFTAYFDESGLSDGEKACVVAGFLGNDTQWCAFSKDWIAAIAPRKSLHVKDLRFHGKYKDRAARVLRKAGPIPRHYNLEPIVGAVMHEDAKASFIANGLDDVFSAPYMLAMQVAILTALHLIGANDELRIVYERQDRYRVAMDTLYEQVFRLRRVDPRITEIIPIEKGVSTCTEAADYLAYMAREGLVNGRSDTYVLGESIFGKTSMVNGQLWQRKQLDDMVSNFIGKGAIIPTDFARK